MMRRRTMLAAGLAITGLAAAGGLMVHDASLAVAATAVVGQQAPDFTVVDSQNQPRNLTSLGGKTVVLEWVSPSCPFTFAQYKSGNMQALQRWATGRGVVWFSVLSTSPSRSDYLPPAKVEAFNRQRGAAPTAVLMDEDGRLGRTYGARTTPHMFVIAPDGTLAYAGAIDDTPSFDPDTVKKSRNLVRAALEDLAAARPVATPSTRPYGCSIGYGS